MRWKKLLWSPEERSYFVASRSLANKQIGPQFFSLKRTTARVANKWQQTDSVRRNSFFVSDARRESAPRVKSARFGFRLNASSIGNWEERADSFVPSFWESASFSRQIKQWHFGNSNKASDGMRSFQPREEFTGTCPEPRKISSYTKYSVLWKLKRCERRRRNCLASIQIMASLEALFGAIMLLSESNRHCQPLMKEIGIEELNFLSLQTGIGRTASTGYNRTR